MGSSAFPGLNSDFETPETRRNELVSMSDTALSERILDMCLLLRERLDGLETTLASAGCIPTGELVASPFGLRACLTGIVSGSCAVHHELRVPLGNEGPAPGHVLHDPIHGQWDRGARRIGKYQSFRHDEPFIVYNPGHMAKWTAHEFLHRALGFFYRDGMSRWEFYLASRLNEIVPVVHWYGSDEVLRLTQDGFVRERDALSPGAPRREAEWLTMSKTALRKRARSAAYLLRQSVEHFNREIDAVKEELRTSYTVRVPDPVLDSSSDALAYTAAHFERVNMPSVRAVLSNVVPKDVRYDTVDAYLQATERLFDQLLFATIDWNPTLARRERGARAVWDLLLRGAHHPDLDANCFVRGIEGAPAGFWRKQANVRVLLSESLDGEAKEDVNAAGFASDLGQQLHTSGPRQPLALRSAEEIVDGIESIAPAVMQVVSPELLADFASETERAVVWSRKALGDRFAGFLNEQGETALCELMTFEVELHRSRPSHDQIPHLTAWPDGNQQVADWMVIRSKSYVHASFMHDIPLWHQQLMQGEPVDAPERRQSDVLIGKLDDAPCVVEIAPAVVSMFELLDGSASELGEVLDVLSRGDLAVFALEGGPEEPLDWIMELAEVQAIALVPPLAGYR